MGTAVWTQFLSLQYTWRYCLDFLRWSHFVGNKMHEKCKRFVGCSIYFWLLSWFIIHQFNNVRGTGIQIITSYGGKLDVIRTFVLIELAGWSIFSDDTLSPTEEYSPENCPNFHLLYDYEPVWNGSSFLWNIPCISKLPMYFNHYF